MARNSEKAMTALARWRKSKLDEENEGGSSIKHTERRPYLASLCDDPKKCEKWRGHIIRDISRKVSQIQNAGLGEFRIRDLNDEINKLLREKRHWEYRIIELGGPDLRRRSRMLDREGKEVTGGRGYKYFGAAKDLPGVRELFDTELEAPAKKTRAELSRNIDAQYYGFRDDEDGILVPLEIEAEARAIEDALKDGEGITDIYKAVPQSDDKERICEAMEEGKEKRFVSHVAIPTQQDIENALLDRKKRELLAMYDIDNDIDQVIEET